MSKEDIGIKKVIVHILDSHISMPVLSDVELEHGSDLSDFLKAHIYRIISGDDIKKCYFGDEDLEIYNTIKEMNEDNFIDNSKILAQKLFDIMHENGDIPPADLFVVVYNYCSRDYLGLLKMNYKSSYTHTTGNEAGSNNNDIIKYKAILPSEGQRLSEAVIVDLQDFSVRIMEKKYDINGKKDFYLSNKFMGCITELSQKTKMSIVNKAVEQVNKKYYEDDFEKQMQAKSIISKEIEEKGCIVVDEVADKIFMGEPELVEEFTEKVDRYAIAHDTIIPQSKTTTRKLEKQHLTTDSGIEIKIPMELYNNEDDVEFITNEDGTMSMIIKNINKIISK